MGILFRCLLVHGLLLALGIFPAWVRGSEPQRVADEFREALARISARAVAKPPEAFEFPPKQARFVRVLIEKTRGTTQPCIDELEVFGPESSENLALAQRGSAASASSCLSGYAIHTIDHLNDGRYGNDYSWIAATAGGEWAQIRLAEPAAVNCVVVTRDRSGNYRDRIPEVFEVLVSSDGEHWQSVGKHRWAPDDRAGQLPNLPIDRLPEKSWDGYLQYAFLRERATWSNLPVDDHLSPLVTDRPAIPGGPPYWGDLARRTPLDRVLVLMEQMIERLADRGLDVSAECKQVVDLRRQAAKQSDSLQLYIAACRAKRRLFFRDPALTMLQCILFAKRHPFLESHNYSEHLDGILQPGGGVCVLRIPRDQQGRFRPDLARIQQLFDGSRGIVREPTADFDAGTIYFAYRPDQPAVDGWESYWHMYAMDADGSNLRQLTDGPFHDFDAVCLPDGGLAFHTTRCKLRFLCWRPQAYVLYRMEADGSNMRRLSHSNLSEWKPSVMQSGKILWTHSEYLDKGADFGHTLWSIHPDGTHPELVFGNNTPNCYSQAHEVPGTRELVCTLMSHGDHQGPIALIDRGKGPFDTKAITNITPDTRPHYQMSRSHHNSFRDPYPISRDHFLVTHNPDDQHNWALYVIDRYGNRELLYVDPEISSKHPTPLRVRPRPPVLASSLDPQLAKRGLGQFTVQDVYQGLGSKVARGRARYLRVAQEVPSHLQPLSDGEYCADHPPFTDFYASPVHLVKGPRQGFITETVNAPLAHLQTNNVWPEHVTQIEPGRYRVQEGNGWPSYVAKASLGTVRIAEDGSANFLAPANKVLYFQLLDKDYNELQRMRSVVQLQPGERRSCVGCHDNRRASPPADGELKPVQPPHELEPPPWGTTAFDYQKVVQPVLDAHCVGCHDGGQDTPGNLRGTLDGNRVPVSYRTLIEGGWVHYFDFTYGMRHFKAEPLSFGTLQSRLWSILADPSHQDVSLGETDMRAIKAWVDLNCPLWPDYVYRPDRPSSRTAHAR